MFWTKYLELCQKNNVKPHTVLRELNISSGSAANWKSGATPNTEILNKISNYFNVSSDFLLSNDEIFIKPADKRNLFKQLLSLPQRWLSLRSGSEVSEEQLHAISLYTNSDFLFLVDVSKTQYSPQTEYDKANLYNIDTLELIRNIMDKCADTDIYRALQIQLSRIVVYHLKNKGISKEILCSDEYKGLHPDKVQFIYTNKANVDITINYGFNLTDLYYLTEKTGFSIQYLFTGVNENPIEEQKKDIEKLKSENEKIKRENELLKN